MPLVTALWSAVFAWSYAELAYEPVVPDNAVLAAEKALLAYEPEVTAS